ncbi:acyl-CoA dehydrogenase family protein [Dactylosporangium sp. CA-092794]|uniref:acyl-CoA dehydrogenase family protein n=1 Tax=Dactylosporangium sp. CA-092794 TaxID=3239929 RepID=UPI003D9399CA
MEAWEELLVEEIRVLARGPIAERARQVDLEGALSIDNINALVALGVAGAGLPKKLGGLGLSLEGSARITETIAYSCGSTAIAVNMHVLVADSLTLGPHFPRADAVLEDVAKNGALICQPGSVPLTGLDTRASGFRFAEDGDFVVGNGVSGFATMSEAARYVKIIGFIERGEGQEPDVVVALPGTDTPGLEICHNWNGMGLRGTASNDVKLVDVRIPRDEVAIMSASAFKAANSGAGGATAVEMQSRFRGMFGSRAIWLGLCTAAFDFTVDYCSRRYGAMAISGDFARAFGAGGDGLRADHAWAQIGVGRMDHWISTGRTLLYDLARRFQSEELSAGEAGVLMNRLNYHLRRMCEEVIQLSMGICGSHAYVKDRPLERIVRDIIGCNVMGQKTDELAQSIGKAALGRAAAKAA